MACGLPKAMNHYLRIEIANNARLSESEDIVAKPTLISHGNQCAECEDGGSHARRRLPARLLGGVLAITATLSLSLSLSFCNPAFAAPAAGDAYVYRLVNGYNGETVAHLRHEISNASTAQGLVVSVTADRPSVTLPRTEMLTPDGQWLRRPLDNHGLAADYEFTPALPAVAAPAAGRTWSVRVTGRVNGEAKARSVRIDGEVLGNERIRVSAGEFDTVKIRRFIYPGDAGDFKTETRIAEIDWYAPTLGHSVRTETRSSWQQLCSRRYCTYHGDWHVLELIEAPKAASSQ